MKQRGARFLVSLGVVLLLLGLFCVPAPAVTILWKAPNANIYIGMPYRSLEFEDPVPAMSKRVRGHWVLEWRDADCLAAGSPGNYEDWTGGGGYIDGTVQDEVWMRQSGQWLTTSTTVNSWYVSIHLNGDDNDGLAKVWVDGQAVALLDMGTPGVARTVCIIVRNLMYSTHTIEVQDLGWGPRSRVGDDVAVLGACALRPNWRLKWWPHFWFLNARIYLVRTRGYITIPTGFWWGWWWYYDYGYWYRPWCGPMWWYRPYCRYWYRIYWDYWPYYCYYRPWWHYWHWWGGRWFWGFRDRLTYRYTYYRPRIIYWWSWYWDPNDGGGCLEVVTQSNENDPAGGRVLPFKQAGIPGFDYSNHQFSVHGEEETGEFSNLEFIQTSELAEYYAGVNDVTTEDVNILMDSEIVQELLKNDPCGVGYIGVQHVTWTHPQSSIIVNSDGGLVIEGDANSALYTVDVNLFEDPGGPETVAIYCSDPCQLEISGADANGVRRLDFTSANWQEPQDVNFTAIDDNDSEGEMKVMVAFYLESDPNEGFTLDVTILDNECGGQGYDISDIAGPGGTGPDCKTNLYDLATVANHWLICSDPSQ